MSDGLHGETTGIAVGQATRLFGSSVDYCLCTHGVSANEVRSVLEWATQPVEWWPLFPESNPTLAGWLEAAGLSHENYGCWWKWFPERVRLNGPEWLVHGAMLFMCPPTWFSRWVSGADLCRTLQDDRVEQHPSLDASLVSLPPQLRYNPNFEAVLSSARKEGREICERKLSWEAFQHLGTVPIPLCEIPLASASEQEIDYGCRGDQGISWAVNFGRELRRGNSHLERLLQDPVVWPPVGQPTIVERFTWMGNFGQWGVPGWSMPNGCAEIITAHAEKFAGRRVLELGTSRGRLSAMLATVGCRLTTVDRHDRGAAQNLDGLGVRVITEDARHFLATTSETFDLIVVDVHGNSDADWKVYAPLLKRCLADPGTLMIDNATLWKIPEWHEETGVRWFLDNLGKGWSYDLHPEPLPGVAIVTRYRKNSFSR